MQVQFTITMWTEYKSIVFNTRVYHFLSDQILHLSEIICKVDDSPDFSPIKKTYCDYRRVAIIFLATVEKMLVPV